MAACTLTLTVLLLISAGLGDIPKLKSILKSRCYCSNAGSHKLTGEAHEGAVECVRLNIVFATCPHCKAGAEHVCWCADFKGELLKLNKELLFAFLESLNTVVTAPSQWTEAFKDVNRVLAEMHHMLNTLRTYQVRTRSLLAGTARMCCHSVSTSCTNTPSPVSKACRICHSHMDHVPFSTWHGMSPSLHSRGNVAP